MPSNAVAVRQRSTILKRIGDGEYLATVADSLGVTPGAISQVLSKDPEYLLARESGIERRLTIREKDLEDADDQLKVARARELLSHQRWRAEREFPQRWAAKQEITGPDGGPIQVQIVQYGRTIEHENVVNNVVTPESTDSK